MRTRRAISSVVGMVFAIIALSSTFVYISYSMNTLSNYNESVLQKNQQLADVNKEKFQISSVTFANNKFNITVANTGNLPLNFTKIWIQNTTTQAGINKDPRSYVPTNSFVSPGGTVTNIGQSFQGVSKTFDTTKPYNIKLVTTRGNTQQFTVNSASSAPLNIQLLAFPPSVSSGFKSQLTMIVTNNGSSMLTNISPSALPATSGVATCVPDLVTPSPSSYNTLAPGSTAVFTWSVKATANNDGDYCKYTFTTPLQGGYAQTVSATITVSKIVFTSTNLAANVGVLTINYTNFKWTQGNTWNSGWNIPKANPTAFSVKLTNNNSTAGTNLYISKNSAMILYKLGTATSTGFYIVQNVTLAPSLTVSASQQYTNCPTPNTDWCVNIPPGGNRTLYFATGPSAGGGGTPPTLDNAATPEPINLIILGKYATGQGNSGTLYAQNIPFIAVNLCASPC